MLESRSLRLRWKGYQIVLDYVPFCRLSVAFRSNGAFWVHRCVYAPCAGCVYAFRGSARGERSELDGSERSELDGSELNGNIANGVSLMIVNGVSLMIVNGVSLMII